jgi:hypothetical protein
MNNIETGGAAALPLRMNRKEVCHALNQKKRGAFVTPKGRPRYDLLNIVFDETDLSEMIGQRGTFSIDDTKKIIFTLNL